MKSSGKAAKVRGRKTGRVDPFGTTREPVGMMVETCGRLMSIRQIAVQEKEL
jgi:hypothetical protein